MPVPIVDVCLEEDEEFMNLYCPACGQRMCGEDLAAFCRHVAFIYVDEAGEFEHVAPRLESLVNGILDEGEEDDDAADNHPVYQLVEQLDAPAMLCLGVTWKGIACGPTSTKAYFGIDFAPEDQ